MNYPNYPPRGPCANYMCGVLGCQGYCGYTPAWTGAVPVVQPGCICPPGSEQTCQALICYRRGAQAPAKAPGKASGKAKGGFARAAAMTPEQRSEQARNAAKARWSASADTHPKGGDAQQAPSLMGSAVGEAETPQPVQSPPLSQGDE